MIEDATMMAREANEGPRVRSVRTIEVVEVVSLAGLGTTESLARNVTEWFLLDGTRIGINDPCPLRSGHHDA